jgi:hypothetical protein
LILNCGRTWTLELDFTHNADREEDAEGVDDNAYVDSVGHDEENEVVPEENEEDMQKILNIGKSIITKKYLYFNYFAPHFLSMARRLLEEDALKVLESFLLSPLALVCVFGGNEQESFLL